MKSSVQISTNSLPCVPQTARPEDDGVMVASQDARTTTTTTTAREDSAPPHQTPQQPTTTHDAGDGDDVDEEAAWMVNSTQHHDYAHGGGARLQSAGYTRAVHQKEIDPAEMWMAMPTVNLPATDQLSLVHDEGSMSATSASMSVQLPPEPTDAMEEVLPTATTENHHDHGVAKVVHEDEKEAHPSSTVDVLIVSSDGEDEPIVEHQPPRATTPTTTTSPQPGAATEDAAEDAIATNVVEVLPPITVNAANDGVDGTNVIASGIFMHRPPTSSSIDVDGVVCTPSAIMSSRTIDSLADSVILKAPPPSANGLARRPHTADVVRSHHDAFSNSMLVNEEEMDLATMRQKKAAVWIKKPPPVFFAGVNEVRRLGADGLAARRHSADDQVPMHGAQRVAPGEQGDDGINIITAQPPPFDLSLELERNEEASPQVSVAPAVGRAPRKPAATGVGKRNAPARLAPIRR